MTEPLDQGDRIDYWDSDNSPQSGTVQSRDGDSCVGGTQYTVWNPEKGAFDTTDDWHKRD